MVLEVLVYSLGAIEPVNLQHGPPRADIADSLAEQPDRVALASPQRRWRYTRSHGRLLRPEGVEHLTEEYFVCPADHADRAAGPTDSDQLVSRTLMTRREYHADRGDHGVKFAVAERQRFRIGLPPLQLHAFCSSPDLRPGQQFRCEVAGNHVGTRLGGRDRDVSRPC